MNRLNLRLVVSFSFILISTLCIMWVALLLVLRSNPPNTDSEAIDLAAMLVEANGLFLERFNAEREPVRPRDREDRTTTDMVLRRTLTEQAELNDVRFMIVGGTDCVLWDTPGYGEYPRSLHNQISSDALIDADRRLGDNYQKGTFEEDGETWLFAANPRTTVLENIVPDIVANTFTTSLLPVCEHIDTPDAVLPISVLAAQPFPEHTFGSILGEYDGLFLALVQAVIIGVFFAFVAAFVIVRWISTPLNDVAGAAFAIGQGDYSQRAPIRGPDEVRMVANTFNLMATKVETTQQAQRDFLANVSHDLRTPLTSIQGFAQAISEGVADGEQARHSANIIESEASRMNRMVNDLLELARIQSGRLEMMRKTVDIRRVLQSVGDSLSMKAQHKQVQFDVRLDNLPLIAGDGDRLAQVFTNLTDNAIKHTPSGGAVWLQATVENGGVKIHVADTGEGIPVEDLPRIFERFYQVDKSRAKAQGTGLGLAIAKEIVEAHGGRIWVESVVGQGTQFNVWLPQPSHDPGATVVRMRT